MDKFFDKKFISKLIDNGNASHFLYSIYEVIKEKIHSKESVHRKDTTLSKDHSLSHSASKDNKKKDTHKHCFRIFSLSAFVIAAVVILTCATNNCSNHIREWLITWTVKESVLLVILLIDSMVSKTLLSIVLKIISFILYLFGVAWIIVGSIWLFTSDGCSEDNYHLWALTLAILIICYTSAVCCCFYICGVLVFIRIVLRSIFKLRNIEEREKDKVISICDRNENVEVAKESLELPQKIESKILFTDV